MFLALFITLAVAVAISTVILVTAGHRVRVSSRLVAIVVGAAIAVGSGELVARVGDLAPQPVLFAEMAILATVVIVAFARPRWNPPGQVFFATFVAAAVSYMVFAASLTFGGGMTVIGTIASAALLGLELFALTLAGYFVFEGCDVICRTRRTRPEPAFDPAYAPKVSLQVPAYNEPPDLLIETIKSLDAIDYPNLEIIVIDNNTEERALWEPVAEFCASRDRVKFVHRDNVPGFKAGALNLVMREEMDPDVEIIGIVDADYRVDPSFLKELVGYFADPSLAFVQTPQDYRSYEGDAYLTACYDAYRYFFVTTMPLAQRAQLDHLRRDDGPHPALGPRRDRRLAGVVHHRGRRDVVPHPQERPLGTLRPEGVRERDHAAHVRGLQGTALPLGVRRRPDHEEALARHAARPPDERRTASASRSGSTI